MGSDNAAGSKSHGAWLAAKLRLTLRKRQHVLNLVFAWIGIATVFYRVHNGWPLSRCFYHAVQAGLSIGFGLFDETDAVSRVFTCVHVLFGTAIAASALVFIVEAAADKVALNIGSALHLRDRNAHLDRQRRLGSLVLLGAVVVIGVVFSIVHEKRSLLDAVYFSVTALSTGGLMPPMDHALSLWFVGAWCLLGVPIFGYALGNIAEAFLVVRLESAVRPMVAMKWSDRDFDRADGLLHADGRVEFEEYLVHSLLSLGVIEPEFVTRIKQEFDSLDVDGSGDLSRAELVKRRRRRATSGSEHPHGV